MTERQEQMIYDEGFRRGFNNGYEACRDDVAEKMMERIEEDGTLVIGVKDATKVARVLVEDEHKNGDLYYADASEEYEWCHDCKEYDTEKHCCPRWNKVIRQTLAELKADRPKGEWIDTGKDKEHLHPLSARWYRCSVCGLETNAKTNYCFDCGADMRGEDNEDK